MNAERSRIQKVREQMQGCDSALITNLVNIRYLTGFTGSAGYFVIGPDSEHLIVDFRYVEQAAAECECRITKRDGAFESNVRDYLLGGTRCAIEANHVTLAMKERLAKTPSIEWIHKNNLVEAVRIRKDEDEIRKLRAACSLLEELMQKTLSAISAGRSELDVALEFEMNARRATGRPLPFQPIIASGYRAALPHGIASPKEIGKGEFVVVDIGLDLDGYIADMTRTVAVGHADERMREVHQAVHLANRTAALGIRPGMTGEAAHMLALGVLEAAKMGHYFGHGLGHGLGIEVHEEPRLAPQYKETLEPGMVFTIEPGVYVPKWGGVRIEDSGVLREHGVEIFNTMERSLIVV